MTLGEREILKAIKLSGIAELIHLPQILSNLEGTPMLSIRSFVKWKGFIY